MLKKIIRYIRKIKFIKKYHIQNLKKLHFKVSDSNSVLIGKNCNCKIIKINISGKNNVLVIGDNVKCDGTLEISIDGYNNKVIIGDNCYIVSELRVFNLDGCDSGKISIGDNSSFYKTEILQYEHKSSIHIGKNCMFGYNTSISNSDGHAIYQDGKLLNGGPKKIFIGDNVWCGGKVSILKNTTILDNSILGKSAVIVGNFKKSNVILAGCPAKIVRENISWSRLSLNQLVMEEKDE